MLNMPDEVRINAFKYVEEGKINELYDLIVHNHDLINVKSQRDGSTLFIRACQYKQKDIIELLLNEGVDPIATNNHGNNGLMYLFYRNISPIIQDVNEHDTKATEILKLLKEKNIPLGCFVAQDADKDTPLIEAAKAALPQSTNFIIKLLHDNNLLEQQLLHENNEGKNTLQIALKNKFFNNELIKQALSLMTSQDTIKLLIDSVIKIDSPTPQEKKILLSLIKEYLPKLDATQIKDSASMAFQENSYITSTGADTSYHARLLRTQSSSGNFGKKLFNTIDVELIELLYVAGGINLQAHKEFINSLSSIESKNLNENKPCCGVILESSKQKILQIIDGSNVLSILTTTTNLQNEKEEHITYIKDLALKRFCFLVANNEKIEISEKSEAKILLDFVNFGNNIKNYHYNIYDNFKKYLIEECKTFENFKKVLDLYGDKITEIVKSDNNLVSKLSNLEESFKDNVDILTNQIEKLLNPNLEEILSRNVFLNFINDKKEENINENQKKLIEDNLKFFTAPNTFQVPEYGKLTQEQFTNSIKYYKNNLESLIPNLVLLKTANDEIKISKLRDFLNNNYVKTKSTVGNCVNVILKYSDYYKSLQAINLDVNPSKKDFQDNILPKLKDAIEEIFNPEVEKVKNNTFLCKAVNEFLNISSITSLFEEYNNNYQAPGLEINNVQEILGGLGIEF